jgi:hypothetical protein
VVLFILKYINTDQEMIHILQTKVILLWKINHALTGRFSITQKVWKVTDEASIHRLDPIHIQIENQHQSFTI